MVFLNGIVYKVCDILCYLANVMADFVNGVNPAKFQRQINIVLKI